MWHYMHRIYSFKGQPLSSMVCATQSCNQRNFTGTTGLGPIGNTKNQRTHGLYLLWHAVGEIACWYGALGYPREGEENTTMTHWRRKQFLS